eukprot:CAMPEP_0180346790 /NCGR_PEP_ID=MMETSP0989-20121125/4063_1 /TAXON_ID=697907 /ORGANISM="non described non described, Strain CCMP2293" /LENGTH=120 /DNA_ID=CAMNT_0022335949 /DNA_START=66 /DNA_END=429 /DNA_ORIENTATION=+
MRQSGGGGVVRHEVVSQRLAELRAEHAKVLLVQVRPGESVGRLRPEERGLAREGVDALEFLVDHRAPSIEFPLRHLVGAVGEGEGEGPPRNQCRKVRYRWVAAVEEDGSAVGVPVEVAEE